MSGRRKETEKQKKERGAFMHNKEKTHGPAAGYVHGEHVVKNINQEFIAQRTLGQRVADRVAEVVGSWPFIIFQSIIIVIWMTVNAYLVYMAMKQPDYFTAWDPYPFILLNLVLSFQAAYTGPIVMMSQNRQSEKDRLAAEQDFQINKKAEEEIRVLMEHLVYQDAMVKELMERIEQLGKRETLA